MKYEEFRKKYMEWQVIPCDFVVKETSGEVQAFRNQLTRWAKRNLLVSLRKGMYAFDPAERVVSLDPMYVANRLYEPSYVSMEFALALYGLIPERVHTLTSVTTRKTKTFSNKVGTFLYQHIKPEAFRGFTKKAESGGAAALVAEPEKAVLDFLYLNLEKFGRNDAEEVLLSSYRFDNLDMLDPEKLMEWSGCYESKKLVRTAETVKAMIEREKQ